MKKLILLGIVLVLFSSVFAGYYNPDWGPVTDYDNNSITLQLPKLRCVNVDAMKRTVFDIEKINEPSTTDYFTKLSQVASPLKETENVILYFKKISENPFEEEYVTFALINGSVESEVCLYPGKYNVSGTLIDYSQTTIPKDKRVYCVGLGGETTLQKSEQVDKAMQNVEKAKTTATYLMTGAALGGVPGVVIGGVLALVSEWFEVCVGSEKTVGMPDQDMDYTPALLGGVELEEVPITMQKLKQKEISNKTLTFYVMAFDKPTLIEELAIIGSYGDITRRADMKNLFAPR